MNHTKPALLPASLMLVFFGVLAIVYHMSLRSYLAGLDKPLVLEMGFFFSLLLTCFYEFKHANWKHNMAACLSAGVYFSVGTWVAAGLRSEYLHITQEVRGVPEIMVWLGKDLSEALSAKVIGYGGCFAGGIMLMRICLDGILRILFTRVFVPVDERLVACSCCGSMVESIKLQESTKG